MATRRRGTSGRELSSPLPPSLPAQYSQDATSWRAVSLPAALSGCRRCGRRVGRGQAEVPTAPTALCLSIAVAMVVVSDARGAAVVAAGRLLRGTRREIWRKWTRGGLLVGPGGAPYPKGFQWKIAPSSLQQSAVLESHAVLVLTLIYHISAIHGLEPLVGGDARGFEALFGSHSRDPLRNSMVVIR